MDNKTSSLLGMLGGAVLGAAAASWWRDTREPQLIVPRQEKVNLAAERLPAVCAHRGLSGLCAENSLAGAAAAAALGADEVEFDVRITRDDKLVVCHDPDIARVTGIAGRVCDFTLAELCAMKLNAGDPNGWSVTFTTPEELLRLLGGRVIFNIHIYEAGKDGWVLRYMRDLIKRRHLERSVYFALRGEALELAPVKAPDIPRCALDPLDDALDIVEEATKHLCVRCQFLSDRIDPDAVRRARELGLVVNVCHADTPDDAKRFIELGADVILSNRADLVLDAARAAR